jgi:hypothetical protein
MTIFGTSSFILREGNMEITSDSIKEQIPYYLTEQQKEGLLRALNNFNKDPIIETDYYSHNYQDELLQGDGWTKLQVRNFDTGERGSILGIILSNTCDVSPDNKRNLSTKITFAPLIPLSAYVALLEKVKIDNNKIINKITSIKEQRVTSIFYLPCGGSLKEDYIALFDELYTMPSKVFESEKEKSKVFTLGLFGFYLFIFKLSIHFCRFHEDVARN